MMRDVKAGGTTCASAFVAVFLVVLALFACTGTTRTTSGAPDGDDVRVPDGDSPVEPDGDDSTPDGELDGDADADEDPEEVDLCGVGDEAKTPGGGPVSPHARTGVKVHNGTETPSLFGIPPEQQLAVGALMANMGYGGMSNFCTGTLISSRVVLTASHCLEEIRSPASVKFAIGRNAARPDATFDVEAFTINPGYSQWSMTPAAHDTAVMILTASVFDVVPDLMPIPANDRALDQSLVGQMVQNGGYGATESSNSNSLKWWIAERVDSVGRGELTVNGMGAGGVCFGDSGGPSLYDFGDGLRVIGTVSWGDENCSGIDHFADVQNDYAWIKEFLDATGDCGDVDEKGRCVGNRALYCENDQLVDTTCHVGTEICDEDGQGRFRCIPDPCEGVTFEGRCDDGDVAVWCEKRQIMRRHCIPCGQTCGWAGDALGYYCVDEEATGRCGTVSAAGCCADGKALWCDEEADILQVQDCGADSCGWNADSKGYFCGSSGSDPSGVHPLDCVSR